MNGKVIIVTIDDHVTTVMSEESQRAASDRVNGGDLHVA